MIERRVPQIVELPVLRETMAIVAAPPITLATLRDAGMVAAGTGRSRPVDEWRLVAGGLHREIFAKDVPPREVPPNLVMLTGVLRGDGVSMSALNLCGSLAANDLGKALLVDLDPHPGSLTDRLGLGGRPGLFDRLDPAGPGPEETIVATAVPGLSVLPIGTGDSGVTHRVARALDHLARSEPARVVILDTPACTAASDASILAPGMGRIVLVVVAERTQRGAVEAALASLRACPAVTVLLNRVRPGAAAASRDA